MNHSISLYGSRARQSLARVALAAILFLVAATTRASVDVFIMFTDRDGVALKGESTDKAFPGSQGWFEIYSYSLGVANPVTIGSATTGAGTGKATFQDLTITKRVDTMSPTFFKALTAGDHFKTGKLVIRKSGGGAAAPPAPYLIYDFNFVFVASQDWSGTSGDDGPTENIALKFGAIRLSYSVQKDDGSLGTPIIQSWSQLSNTSVFDSP